jgi:Protein of unknown function (DUF4230)
MLNGPVDQLQPRRPARGFVRSWAAGGAGLLMGVLLGILLLGSAAGLLLSRTSGRNLLGRVFSAVTGRTLTIDVSQPTVVDRIQRLQRLETVVYTMDKLVTGAKENVLPDFLTGDRLLMMVHEEVVAGIDLSGLKANDVRVEGKQGARASSGAAGVHVASRQREDSGLFTANRAAGADRSEPGNTGAPGSGTAAARGGDGRWYFAKRAGECGLDDPEFVAGVGLRRLSWNSSCVVFKIGKRFRLPLLFRLRRDAILGRLPPLRTACE